MSCSPSSRPVSAPDVTPSGAKSPPSARPHSTDSFSRTSSSSHTQNGRLPTLSSSLLPSFARDRRLPPPIPTSSAVTDPREYTSTTLRGGWPQPGAGLARSRLVRSAPSAPSLARSTSARMLKPTGSMPRVQGNVSGTSIHGAGPSSTSVSGLSASYPGQGELLRYQKREADFEMSPRPQRTLGNGYGLLPTVPPPAIVSSARAGRECAGTASPGRLSPAMSSGSPERKPKDYTVLRNDFDAQARSAHPAHRVFPEGDPRIPPMRHPEPQAESSSSSQAKRTIFTPYELSILQDLWTKGAYYPAHWQVEQVQSCTGLTRVQIRNWCVSFAFELARSRAEPDIAACSGLRTSGNVPSEKKRPASSKWATTSLREGVRRCVCISAVSPTNGRNGLTGSSRSRAPEHVLAFANGV